MTETRRRNAQNNMAVPEDEESLLPSVEHSGARLWKAKGRHKQFQRNAATRDPGTAVLIGLVMVLALLLTLAYWLFFYTPSAGHALPETSPCDTVSQGYQCAPSLSHTWGQYSPYYLVPSEVASNTPPGCKIDFAQLLSRHGARSPTAYKARLYNETLIKIHSTATNLTGPYAHLRDYAYDLGSEDLTPLGEQELVSSGIDFFTRYEALAAANTPFVRAGDQKRVVDSARKWSEGFHKAKTASGTTQDLEYPYFLVEISEADGMNNTLNHGICTAFESNKTGPTAQAVFGQTFLPIITARLNQDMGTALTDMDMLSLMELCPFTVVADTVFPSASTSTTKATLSGASPLTNPFCALFTPSEWESYDYLQNIGKYYGYGGGSRLGPTQGVGWVNELIARLTSTPVDDHTSVNHTLDADPAMFPLGRAIYADFSHDNDMTGVIFALGLYQGMPELDKGRIMDVEEMGGYAASRTVPFGGRMVVEKMVCDGAEGGKRGEMVRVLVNGRVMPLEMCGGDEAGRCGLGKFVESLSFAREGGRWDECFVGMDGVQGTADVETA